GAGRKAPGIARRSYASPPEVLAAGYFAEFEYTVSGGNVSTGPGRRAARDPVSSLVDAAVQSSDRIAGRRFRAAGPGGLVRSRAPGLCSQAAIRPSRLVPRPDRPARAACPRAAQMPRPRRTDRPAAPWQVRHPARVRGPLTGWRAA